jgi:biopolymer transport protein ExbD
MAGAQGIGEKPDNPIVVNVTAMVDVIFCLCIFFFCTFHFRQLEKKMDTWLPKDRYTPVSAIPPPVLEEEVRITLRLDRESGSVRRTFGARPAASDADLRGLLRNASDGLLRAGLRPPRVVLDAEGSVPWKDVVRVIDLCRKEGLDRIEFSGDGSSLNSD